jgi:predicted DNA-binding transcriptional regulator AlpA
MEAIKQQPQQQPQPSQANTAPVPDGRITRESLILDGYITRESFAAQLGKSLRTIDRWQTQRIGPPRVVIGNTVLFRVASVRAWLESSEQREQRKGRRGR